MQEILHWQANTVGMMYSLIADAIKAKGARHLHECMMGTLHLGVRMHICRQRPAPVPFATPACQLPDCWRCV